MALLSIGSERRLWVESGQRGDLDRAWLLRYRRSVPVTTISTLQLPHREHTSRSRHSTRSLGVLRQAKERRFFDACLTEWVLP